MVRILEEAEHMIERVPISRTTGRVPTDAFLLAAAGSVVGSLALKLMGRHRDAEFVGHWAPTLVALGLLSKLIDHDRHSARAPQRRMARKSKNATP